MNIIVNAIVLGNETNTMLLAAQFVRTSDGEQRRVVIGN